MPMDEEIRARAHQLWEEAGKLEGREHEFWYQSERELQHNQIQPNQPEGSVGEVTTKHLSAFRLIVRNVRVFR